MKRIFFAARLILVSSAKNAGSLPSGEYVERCRLNTQWGAPHKKDGAETWQPSSKI